MSENTTETAKEEVKTQPMQETQKKEEKASLENDPHAIETFVAMGYDLPLPASLVGFYKSFKLRKDRIYAGMVSPEGFAFVALLDEMYKRLKK